MFMFKKTPPKSGDAFALALDNEPLSIPAAILVMGLSVPICATAFYVNRDYAVANLILLQLDEASLAVRKLSIDLFLSTDVAAFFIIALLIGPKYKYWRWKLFILGLVIWAFDCATMYQARFGIMLANQTVSVRATSEAEDNKKAIDAYRASAASWMATAAEQRQRGQIKKGAESQASADEALKAAEKLQPVKTTPADKADKKPAAVTEVQIWGSEARAKYKAFIESVIVSLIKLFMSGLSGAMVRAVRERIFYNKYKLTAAPTSTPAPGQPVAPGAATDDAPAAPAQTAAPGADADAPAAAAPAAPEQDRPPFWLKKEYGFVGVKKAPARPGNDDTLPSQGGVNVDTPPPVIVDTPAPAAKARKTRPVRDGMPMDTGTGPLDGFRYRRAVAGVQDRTIRPSLSGLYDGVGVSAPVARRFIEAMALAGEIVRNEEDTGWIPAPKKAATKAKKGGTK